MTAKHTPLPWTVLDADIVASDNVAETVCSMEWSTADEGVIEANARLIAAAPDLLDALKRLLAFVEAHTLNGDVVPPHTVEHERSRAAITKAEAAP